MLVLRGFATRIEGIIVMCVPQRLLSEAGSLVRDRLERWEV